MIKDAHLVAISQVGFYFAFDCRFAINDLEVFEVSFLMVFMEEAGLYFRYLILLLIESDVLGEGSFAEKVVIFVEVDFDAGQGG